MLELKSEKNYRQGFNPMLSDDNNQDNFKFGIILLSVFIVFMIPDDITHCCIMDTKKVGNLLQGISVLDAGIMDNVVSFLLLLLYVVCKEVPQRRSVCKPLRPRDFV